MYTLLILNAAVMRLNEIMGLEQSRAWGVCSLNDFRKFLGLKSRFLAGYYSAAHLAFSCISFHQLPRMEFRS